MIPRTCDGDDCDYGEEGQWYHMCPDGDRPIMDDPSDDYRS